MTLTTKLSETIKAKPSNGSILKAGKPLYQIITSLWQLGSSKTGWLTTLGSLASDMALRQEKEELKHLQSGFNNLNVHIFGRAAGHLIADWLTAQNLKHPQDNLNEALRQLDRISETPIEMALHRYLVSKVHLALSGFHSESEELPMYQVYQRQARQMLMTMPQYRRISQSDIYTGKPFSGEATFTAAHRLLTMLTPETEEPTLKAFLSEWVVNSPMNNSRHFYGALLALTHRPGDPLEMGNRIDQWFDQYQRFLNQRLKTKEKWLMVGLGLISSDLLLGRPKRG